MDPLTYKVGQRWANTAEPELGSGIILQREGRMLTLFFPAAEATRTYATTTAPLTRIEYRVGDRVENTDGEPFNIIAVFQDDGLFIYQLQNDAGEKSLAKEAQIVGSSAHAGPIERLLHGQSDRHQWFRLRHDAWQHQHDYDQSPFVGLLGPRVDLIPHQFHIAREVSARIAPRVMLADEVGLGKTIEAGLIAHRLLAQGRIQRLLILVPHALVNQWLVEMLRRFNLPVRLFNAEQCNAICAAEGTDNPFETEQVVLCDLDFLLADDQRREQALATQWDLLVVDEAHHLAWSPQGASDAYQLTERFAQQSRGLLLLTATPEKEGHQSHFAQLHLLDPARYHDIEQFIDQQTRFEAVAAIAENLIQHKPVSQADLATLRELLNDQDSQSLLDQLTQQTDTPPELSRQLAERLLDQQGTGRVLFRNTRHSIPDFPVRSLHACDFEWPSCYSGLEAELYPESQVAPEQWLGADPRVSWLEQILKQHKRDKFLVICHHRDTACELERHLRLRSGILCAAFHEDLSILERDRAAAWFADDEAGAQVLICSEIGSEGRNFQFCHQLVLFDLPTPVDLLEQRIGRLDRIGQQQDISIHALYFNGTHQQALFRWYHEGLNAFEQTSAASSVVYSQLAADFSATLYQDEQALNDFIQHTHQQSEQLHHQFIHGRNRLLELHSKGDNSILTVLEQIREQEDDSSLPLFLDRAFDQYGVETEELSPTTLLLRAGPQLEDDHFPGLQEDGTSITFDRSTALARDDIQFLTWDHPTVRGVIDLITTGERGKASICLLQNKQLNEGTLLVELLFVAHCTAPKRLQLHHVLPATPIRLLLDTQGRNLAQAVGIDALDKKLKNVKGELVAAVLKNFRHDIERLISKATHDVISQFITLRDSAIRAFERQLNDELARLRALASSNPAISAEEIDALVARRDEGLQQLRENTHIHLDGVRVMVTVK